MIMAASAGDRGGQKSLSEGINFVVQHFLMDAIKLRTVAVAFLTHLVEHRADQRFVDAKFMIQTW